MKSIAPRIVFSVARALLVYPVHVITTIPLLIMWPIERSCVWLSNKAHALDLKMTQIEFDNAARKEDPT